jgi:hypothetical protein
LQSSCQAHGHEITEHNFILVLYIDHHYNINTQTIGILVTIIYQFLYLTYLKYHSIHIPTHLLIKMTNHLIVSGDPHFGGKHQRNDLTKGQDYIQM